MKFSKMHGLGNDFVVIEKINNDNLVLSSSLIKLLSNRNTGIGFNQLLLIEKTNKINCDFNYRIFNSDGTEVEQCGNGARCVAMFLKIKKLIKKKNIILSTKHEDINISFLKDMINVSMGVPNFDSTNILFSKKNKKDKYYKIQQDKNIISTSLVSIGNPHCIINVDDVNKIEVDKIGSFISNHKMFPKKINVSFLEKINQNKIKLRVYERGVGETLACGTAACASVAIGIKKKFLSNNVEVNLPGGKLTISWKGKKESIFMTGPAVHIYDGSINLKKFISNF